MVIFYIFEEFRGSLLPCTTPKILRNRFRPHFCPVKVYVGVKFHPSGTNDVAISHLSATYLKLHHDYRLVPCSMCLTTTAIKYNYTRSIHLSEGFITCGYSVWISMLTSSNLAADLCLFSNAHDGMASVYCETACCKRPILVLDKAGMSMSH
jgi:hypothetical protein